MIEHTEGDCSKGCGKETEKASEAKSNLTNGMTSKALVEDLNVLTGW